MSNLVSTCHQAKMKVIGDQLRLETGYYIGRAAEKMKFTDELCGACYGTGRCPVVMFGTRDACAVCLGTGKKIDWKKK